MKQILKIVLNYCYIIFVVWSKLSVAQFCCWSL